jgi:hypothetical protein
MLTTESLKAGRMQVLTGEEYAAAARLSERDKVWMDNQGFVLAGTTQINGTMQVPYPYRPQDGKVTVLRRDQAEHLAIELLRKLAPGGELPDDSAELVDFISSLNR